MPEAVKNYAITDLAGKDSLVLKIDGKPFAVSSFTASFAINEIPQAQCYLAVGRDARSLNAATAAAVHDKTTYTQMTKAEVVFAPTGEYLTDGTTWPEEPQVIFKGYFTGFSSRKVQDKFVVVANLIHWLADLACSSTLTKNGHFANATQLNVAAVEDNLRGAGAARGNYISSLAASQLVQTDVADDVWGAIRGLFCALADTATAPCGPVNSCGGSGTYTKNDRALEALALIEGGGSGCAFTPTDGEQRYAVPLKLAGAGDDALVQQAVADAIAKESIESYASTTFWDKLVSRFCPMFGMAVVPMVSRALVIADLPARRGKDTPFSRTGWRELGFNYDSLNFTAALERPQRGVGVIAKWQPQTSGGVEADGTPQLIPGTTEQGGEFPVIGGCYVEDSVSEADGILQFVEAPSWIQMISATAAYANESTAIPGGAAARGAGLDAPGVAPAAPLPGTMGETINRLYRDYAHLVYVNNMLRGRVGSVTGKLRFDIAPGSIVLVDPRAEPGIGIVDDGLGVTQVGCVNRVSIAINAEGPSAATAFSLTHMRSYHVENKLDRTSIVSHPLFGEAIHGGGRHGAPLVPAYDLHDPGA